MANNRLYIRCKGCKGFMAFAKFYPTGGFIGGPTVEGNTGWYTQNKDLGEDLNTFFLEHEKHNEMDNFGSFWDVVDEQDPRVKLYDFEHRVIEMEEAEENKKVRSAKKA